MADFETITALGYDIPVWDYYTAGEREALEALIASQDEQVRSRYDLEVLRIFLRTRCKQKVKMEALLDKPVYGDEVAIAVEVLCNPFFEILRERALRREKQRVERTTNFVELTKARQYHETMLQIVDEQLQASGDESEH